MDPLARNIMVDKDFGQSLGQIGRPLDMAGIAGQGEAHRTVGVQQYPAGTPAQLVAGALDDHPGRCQLCPHGGPRAVDGLGGVLTQDIECPHDYRPQPGQFEPAHRELHRGVGGVRVGNPLRVDLQTDHPHCRGDRAQAGGQFGGGHR